MTITVADNYNLGNAKQLAEAAQDIINNKLTVSAKSDYDTRLAATDGELADVIAVLGTMFALGVVP